MKFSNGLHVGALIMAAVLCVVGPLIFGCGPNKPDVATAVVQSFEATHLSILDQVDWNQVMTHLHGQVGPDTEIVTEAYTKQVAGFTVRFRGGELSIDTQASGTGGRGQGVTNAAIIPEVQKVLTRWEQADNLNAQQKQQIAKEIADAIVQHFQKAAATQPATAADKPAS